MENDEHVEIESTMMGGNIEKSVTGSPVAVQDQKQTPVDHVQSPHRVVTHRDVGALDMAAVANSLPTYAHGGSQPMYNQHMQPIPNQNASYQYPNSHYSGPSTNFASPFSNQLPMHYQGQRMYGPYNTGTPAGQYLYPNQMPLPNQVMVADGAQPYLHHLPPGSVFSQSQLGQQTRGSPNQSQYGYTPIFPGQMHTHDNVRDMQHFHPAAQTSNTLRGPPRKPKQSGHALWVGNLPPGTNIVDLKDHFSRNATNDIESVFLISKSNCAFVNYKTDQSCTAAMARFHDSRFQGVRLVCRLRRGSAPAGSPATGSPNQVNPGSKPSSLPQSAEGLVGETEEKSPDKAGSPNPNESREKVKERFFVIKSLTMEDLERSVQSGVWATQSHNEASLNQAYASADNVYLIFSANKSGEYFGYARMESTIDDESAASIAENKPDFEKQSSPEAQNPLPASLPVTIPTLATATAPKGHIIDDSARGTIFWEAEQEDVTNTEPDVEHTEEDDTSAAEEGLQSPSSASVHQLSSPSPPQTTYGKPFKIVWQSTERLPFYRTRGLRNPWNTNREVKIARDGTEIEPSVGRRLVDMFGTQAAMQGRPQPGYVEGMIPVGPGMIPHAQGPGFGRGY